MAVLTSPDAILSVTVTVGNQEADGTYPILISTVTPAGQHFAVEYNGVRIYEDNAAPGTGSEG
jgi:hypothetical protein